MDAPGAVRVDVESVLFILVHHPGLGHKVETERPIQVRRCLMSKTQHWLYYRAKGSLLEVLCLGHGPRFRAEAVKRGDSAASRSRGDPPLGSPQLER